MDRSLFLLLRLRTWAWLRRMGRNLRSLKGALLGVVGALLFAPMLVSSIFAPRIHVEAQSELIRRYGALGMLAFCVLNVVLSSGERAIYYSPSEVNFLFSGPYRSRQLLLYKVAAGFGAGLATTPFMTLAFAHHAKVYVSAFVGLFLAIQFLALFTIGLGLAGSTLGALAFSRGRRVILAALVVLLIAALAPLGKAALAEGPRVLLERAVASPVVSLVSLPFEPFVRAFTATAVWPELVYWSILAAGVDLGLLLVVLRLNSHFLEASAAASSRIYARLQRTRRGDIWAGGSPKVRIHLSMIPWWGGIGPNLWRQLTTATRQLSKLIVVSVLILMPAVMVPILERGIPNEPAAAATALSMMVAFAVFAPSMIGFDFRPDLERMEDLKTLPIPPSRLVLGQLATPVVILSLIEWFGLALIAISTRPSPLLFWGVLALTPPVNLLFVAVENLYFLWFPFRMTAMNTLDFQAMGRQVLLGAAKLATIGVAAALACGAGALAFLVTSQSRAAAIVAAWFVLSACGLALIPLVSVAFTQFDVAQAPPD